MVKETTVEYQLKKNSLKLFHEVKEYAEQHTAIFVFLSTTFVTVVSYLIKILFYAYQIGYNLYFNVPTRYIKLSENDFYGFFLYVAFAIFMIMFNAIAQSYLERRKLFSYFLNFTMILTFVMLFLSLVLDYKAFITDAKNYIIMIISFSVTIVLTLHAFIISNYFYQSDSTKISRLNALLELKQKKLEKFKVKLNCSKFLYKIWKLNIDRLTKNIERLNTKIQNIEDKIQSKTKSSTSKADQFHSLLIFLLVFAFLIIWVDVVGYFTAYGKKNIKVIPNEYLNTAIDNKHYNYAVLFENDDIYLICPCKENDTEGIELFSKIQIEINKKDIVVVNKKFTSIR